MRGFTAVQIKPRYFMRELIPVDLLENDEGVLKTNFGNFELPTEFSDRVRMLLDEKIPQRYSSYTELSTGDCHSFSWGIVTGSISFKNGVPGKKELQSVGLSEIGIIDLTKEDSDWFLDGTLYKGNELIIGDLFVKYSHSGDNHSMIYLGNNDTFGPIFISKVGRDGHISIHTIGQIMRYYNKGKYSIFRSNSGFNEQDRINFIKIKLAEKDYSPCYTRFDC